MYEHRRKLPIAGNGRSQSLKRCAWRVPLHVWSLRGRTIVAASVFLWFLCVFTQDLYQSTHWFDIIYIKEYFFDIKSILSIYTILITLFLDTS